MDLMVGPNSSGSSTSYWPVNHRPYVLPVLHMATKSYKTHVCKDSLITHPQAPHPVYVRSSEFIANISILPRLAQLLVLVQGQMVVLHSLSALEILTRHQEIKLHWTCSMRECSTKKGTYTCGNVREWGWGITRIPQQVHSPHVMNDQVDSKSGLWVLQFPDLPWHTRRWSQKWCQGCRKCNFCRSSGNGNGIVLRRLLHFMYKCDT